ncbi:MAG: 50S ribosomal protein L9 [Victivallales bacterium]|nr:50S ribosomal protein L9 [Victivallales bacterium]
MAVQLILLEDVADLGKIGDNVHVSPGYARNYLLPRKLAAVATPGILKKVEARKLQLQKEHEERIAVAKAMADKIAKVVLSIGVKAGEDDKLFGSVNAQQIADAAAKEGIEIEKTAIVLDGALKELGSFDIPVKLHSEVTASLKVKVVREDAAPEA